MYQDNKGCKWFKGNLHTHTTVSDGLLSPEEACRLYKTKGYDFLALTDHWTFHPGGEFEGMTLLSGCEYDVIRGAGLGTYHTVAIGMERAPKLTRLASVQQVINSIHRCGGIAIYAHPAWSLNTTRQLMALKRVDAAEIFNSVSDQPRNCRADSGLLLDILAKKGKIWNLTAADDAHFYEEADRCRSYIMVRADRCDRESLLAAIRAGDFYATQGPRLEAYYEDGRVKVDCSPVSRITYFTDTPWSAHRSDVGQGLLGGEYVPSEADRVVRVEAVDEKGCRAWSQYIKVR